MLHFHDDCLDVVYRFHYLQEFIHCVQNWSRRKKENIGWKEKYVIFLNLSFKQTGILVVKCHFGLAEVLYNLLIYWLHSLISKLTILWGIEKELCSRHRLF